MYYPDEIVHILLGGGEARALVLRTTALSRIAADIHQTSDAGAAALSRLMTGACMLAAMQKGENDSVTVIVAGGGAGGKMTAVARRGLVKATCEHPQAELAQLQDGSADVPGFVGNDGTITVIKDEGKGDPYIGRCKLVSGGLGEDFAQYYTLSEQIPSLVSLGAHVQGGAVLSCGGVLIQAMPDCSESLLEALEVRAMLFSGASRDMAENTLDELMEGWFAGLNMEILSRNPLAWQCDCSRERMARALTAMGRSELQSMIDEDGEATLTCHFCRAAQHFSKDELLALMP